MASIALGIPSAAAKEKPGTRIKEHRKDLESISNEIKAKRDEVKNLLKKENSIISILDRLDREIDKTRKRSRHLQTQQAAQKQSIRTNSKKILLLEKEQGKLQATVKQKLRNLHLLGDMGYARIMLSANGWRDFVKASYVVRRMVDQDLETIQHLAEKTAALSQQREELRLNQDRLANTVQSLEKEKTTLRQQRRRQRSLLRLTKTQKDFSQKSLNELQEAAENLQKLVDRLGRSGRDSGFGQMRGGLILPVDAPIIGKFGRWLHPQLKTWVKRSGVELKVKSGVTVRAVFAGSIIYAGWFKGYGKIVILDHGGGYYTMSAHLDEVHKKVGDRVAEGESIGLSGATGSLKGPLLYFELRHEGRAINPLPWFNPLKAKLAR